MSDYDQEPDTFVRDRVSQARDLMIEAIDHHEEINHGGGPCVSERLGITAFLAHSAGVTLDALPMFAIVLAEYQVAHEAHEAADGHHRRNGHDEG